MLFAFLLLPHGSSFVFLALASILPAKAKNPTAASVRLACWSPPAAGLSWFLGWHTKPTQSQKPRHPLAASSCHPSPSFLGTSKSATGGSTRSRLAIAAQRPQPVRTSLIAATLPTLAQGCFSYLTHRNAMKVGFLNLRKPKKEKQR